MKKTTMEPTLEPKILAPVRILQILSKYSDEQHPMTQAEIINKLHTDYNLVVERKTVARNITNLQAADFDIETTRKGSYLAGRVFDDSELRLLIDGVLFSKHISERYANDLIAKLADMGSVNFSKNAKRLPLTKRIRHEKAPHLFADIDLLAEAIELKHKVSFIYNRYNIEKKLEPVWNEQIVVTPLHLAAFNGHYYLLGVMDEDTEIVNFRIEKISNLTLTDLPADDLLDTKIGDINKYLNARPYAYAGKAQNIVMQIDKIIMDDVMDYFGDDFRVLAQNEYLAKINLQANPADVTEFALQYALYVEILSPQIIRDQLGEITNTLRNRYIVKPKNL